MATINKVRISGFTYNNGMSMYPDEVFDFDGLQTLIQQANGTGKTTLIQMLLATVVAPGKCNTKISMRQMVEQRGFRDCHFLIEWILDGLPGGAYPAPNANRVLCGYSIRKSVGENPAWDIKYYFAVYGAQEGFSIEDIPLSRHGENGGIITAGYDAVSDFKKTCSFPDISVYSASNFNNYKRRCEEYGLPVKDWADLGVKVNHDGANLADYLKSNCKSSTSLFELLIEPSLKSRIAAGEQRDSLEESTVTYLERVYSNRGEIELLEAWREFEERYTEVSKSLASCSEDFEWVGSASRELAGMRVWADAVKQACDEELAKVEEGEERVESDLLLAEQMRLSKAVHEAVTKLSEIKAQQQEATGLLEAAATAERSALCKWGDLKYTLHCNKKDALTAAIARDNGELAALEQEGELGERRDSVACRLVEVVTREKQTAEQAVAQKEQEHSARSAELEKLEAEKDALEREQVAVKERCDKASALLEHMQEEERNALKQLNTELSEFGCSLAVALDGKLRQSRIAAESSLDIREERAAADKRAALNEKARFDEQVKEQRRLQAELEDKLLRLAKTRFTATAKLEGAQELLAKADSFCAEHDAELRVAFRHNTQGIYAANAQSAAQSDLVEAEVSVHASQERLDSKKTELDQARSRLEELAQGRGFADAHATAALEKARIGYATVIERLQELRAADTVEARFLLPLVSEGRLMPYGLIVRDEATRVLAVETINSVGTDKPTPVYTQEHIDALIMEVRSSGVCRPDTTICASNPWGLIEITPQVMLERQRLIESCRADISRIESDVSACERDLEDAEAVLRAARDRLALLDKLVAFTEEVEAATGGKSIYDYEADCQRVVASLVAESDKLAADKDAAASGETAARQAAEDKADLARELDEVLKRIKNLRAKVAEADKLNRKIISTSKERDKEREALAKCREDIAAIEGPLLNALDAKESAHNAFVQAQGRLHKANESFSRYGMLTVPSGVSPCEELPLEQLSSMYDAVCGQIERENQERGPQILQLKEALKANQDKLNSCNSSFASWRAENGFGHGHEFVMQPCSSELHVKEAKDALEKKTARRAELEMSIGTFKQLLESAQSGKDKADEELYAEFEQLLEESEIRQDIAGFKKEIKGRKKTLQGLRRTLESRKASLVELSAALRRGEQAVKEVRPMPAEALPYSAENEGTACVRAEQLAAECEEHLDTFKRNLASTKRSCSKIREFANRSKRSAIVQIFDKISHMVDMVERYEEERTQASFSLLVDMDAKTTEGIKRNIAMLDNNISGLEANREQTVTNLTRRASCLCEQVRALCLCSGFARDSRGSFKAALRMTQTDERAEPDEELAQVRIRRVVEAMDAKVKAIVPTDKNPLEAQLKAIYNEYAASTALLQCYLDINKLKVEVLKVVRNGSTEWASWEECAAKHSGAELFCDCLTVIAATSLYNRQISTGKTTSVKSAVKNCTYGTTMILDNPFGETSTAEFVDYMYAVASRSKMQLICFSAHTVPSVIANIGVCYAVSFDKRKFNGRISAPTATKKLVGSEDTATASEMHYKVRVEKDVYADPDQTAFEF